MADLLIAGFDPFEPYLENPSWTVARALRNALSLDGVDAAAVCLPVAFGDTEAALRSALDTERPRAVLGLGLSGQTAFLDIEQIAVNVGQHAAEAGGSSTPFPLGEAGPDARRNQLDWDPLARTLREQGLPARLSFHAGTFLCNAAYYTALGWAEQNPARRAVFVHMPLLPDMAARHYELRRTALPSLHVETMLAILRPVSHRLLEA